MVFGLQIAWEWAILFMKKGDRCLTFYIIIKKYERKSSFPKEETRVRFRVLQSKIAQFKCTAFSIFFFDDYRILTFKETLSGDC